MSKIHLAINSSTALNAAISAWKIYLEDQGRSIHTIKAFIADATLLASFLQPDRTIGSITTRELNDFLTWLQDGRGIPCSPKTLSRRITSLKSFFKWLHASTAIAIDPAERVVQKSVISPLPAVLTAEEADQVLEVASHYRTREQPDARPYVLLKLLLETGIKKGELLNLKVTHLELGEQNAAFIFVRYSSPNHRYKERKLPLSQDWVNAFADYQSQYDLSKRLFPWSPRRLEYLLQEIGERAGLDTQLSFLMCRWTSALLDFQNGVEPTKIRQKLGISEIQWREINMKLQKIVAPPTR